MIRRYGPRDWDNIHLTKRVHLADLIDVDNTVAGGPPLTGFAVLKQAADTFQSLITEARQQGIRIRGLGSAWALTDIACTDGWLVNTKLLNGCFDLTDQYFDPSYPSDRRQLVALAQCGISIGELNIYLERGQHSPIRRAMRTSGIGAGQTIAGAFSGNTHGAAVQFGSTPDIVVGIHLVTGTGQPLWIERASYPVVNDLFVSRLGATLVRNDDVFDAAVVSFGAFGLIASVAIETEPIYQLLFPPVEKIGYGPLASRLAELSALDRFTPSEPYHYEFVFNPYDKDGIALATSAVMVEYEEGHPAPEPMWIARNEKGFALGVRTARLFLDAPLIRSEWKSAIEFTQYQRRAILGDIRATPGQLFTASITYLEGYNESALGISLTDAPAMIEIASDVIRRLDVPCISQVRLVHPSRGLLAFTGLTPKTAVFEWGVSNDDRYPLLERTILQELEQAGIGYTLHWSKNAGIDPATLDRMYGTERVECWRSAREQVFGGDKTLMRTFDNDMMVKAGLGAPP